MLDLAYIKALITKREGYARFGRDDRVADVDAELERVLADVDINEAVAVVHGLMAAAGVETPSE